MGLFNAQRISKELTFSAVTTAESSKQRVQVTKGGQTISFTSALVRRIHLERSAGLATVNFTVRLYDSATGDKLLIEKTLSLAESGSAAQSSQEGYMVLTDSGLWASVEAASGSGHEVKLVCQLDSPRRG